LVSGFQIGGKMLGPGHPVYVIAEAGVNHDGEVEKALRGRYFKKRIDEDSFKKIIQDYETKLSEIEVKIKRLEKKK